MAWRFVLADKSGDSLGELRASSRNWTAGVSRSATATCRVHETDPLWGSIDAGTSRLKVYDSPGTLRFYGPIVSVEETGDGQVSHLQLNAMDVSWFLTGHFSDTDFAGSGRHYQTDSGAIVKAHVDAARSDGCAPGVVMGTISGFPTRDITYAFKRDFDVLAELGAIGGSYEWSITYSESDPSTKPTTTINLNALIGSDHSSGSSAVFLEYGTGRANCSTYRRVRTVDQQATWVWAIGADLSLVAVQRNTAVPATYGYERMDVLQLSDVSDVALLQALASAHVNARKNTREIDEVTSTVLGAPVYGTDYAIGDYVWLRIVAHGSARADGKVRIWAISVNLDENGNEIPTFQLMP